MNKGPRISLERHLSISRSFGVAEGKKVDSSIHQRMSLKHLWPFYLLTKDVYMILAVALVVCLSRVSVLSKSMVRVDDISIYAKKVILLHGD